MSLLILRRRELPRWLPLGVIRVLARSFFFLAFHGIFSFVIHFRHGVGGRIFREGHPPIGRALRDLAVDPREGGRLAAELRAVDLRYPSGEDQRSRLEFPSRNCACLNILHVNTQEHV